MLNPTSAVFDKFNGCQKSVHCRTRPGPTGLQAGLNEMFGRSFPEPFVQFGNLSTCHKDPFDTAIQEFNFTFMRTWPRQKTVGIHAPHLELVCRKIISRDLIQINEAQTEPLVEQRDFSVLFTRLKCDVSQMTVGFHGFTRGIAVDLPKDVHFMLEP